jgi:hypothetical protein
MKRKYPISPLHPLEQSEHGMVHEGNGSEPRGWGEDSSEYSIGNPACGCGFRNRSAPQPQRSTEFRSGEEEILSSSAGEHASIIGMPRQRAATRSTQSNPVALTAMNRKSQTCSIAAAETRALLVISTAAVRDRSMTSASELRSEMVALVVTPIVGMRHGWTAAIAIAIWGYFLGVALLLFVKPQDRLPDKE